MKKKCYRIHKILNNNAIEVFDHGNEIIIFGNGLGFSHRAGDYVEMEESYKLYTLQNSFVKSQFESILNEIPFQCIELTQTIIDMAKQELKRDFNQGLLISLADHINFVVKSHIQGKDNYTLVSEEVKRFYHTEYETGKKAVALINDSYHIQLSLDEASAIAFHLINSEYGNDTNETTSILKSIEDLLQLIRSMMELDLSENALYYSRFIIHLKFFMQRVIKGEKANDETFEKLVISTKYDADKKIERTLDAISVYLMDKYQYQLSEAERFYLLVHIARII